MMSGREENLETDLESSPLTVELIEDHPTSGTNVLVSIENMVFYCVLSNSNKPGNRLILKLHNNPYCHIF